MTRQERVGKYMEILKKAGKGNSTRNWAILDRLSDKELFDGTKVAECLQIIDKCEARIQSNTNKYPENIMESVRQSIDLEEWDDSQDNEINEMTPNEIFEHVCTWEGFYSYADTIKQWINDIYKIDLDALSTESASDSEETVEEIDDGPYSPSATNGDYSPSNPWDAPGMSIKDFI